MSNLFQSKFTAAQMELSISKNIEGPTYVYCNTSTDLDTYFNESLKNGDNIKFILSSDVVHTLNLSIKDITLSNLILEFRSNSADKATIEFLSDKDRGSTIYSWNCNLKFNRIKFTRLNTDGSANTKNISLISFNNSSTRIINSTQDDTTDDNVNSLFGIIASENSFLKIEYSNFDRTSVAVYNGSYLLLYGTNSLLSNGDSVDDGVISLWNGSYINVLGDITIGGSSTDSNIPNCVLLAENSHMDYTAGGKFIFQNIGSGNCFKATGGAVIDATSIEGDISNITGSYNILNEVDTKGSLVFDTNIKGVSTPITSGDIKVGSGKLTINKEYLFSSDFGSSLPTEDPGVSGTLWNNAGVLSISV